MKNNHEFNVRPYLSATVKYNIAYLEYLQRGKQWDKTVMKSAPNNDHLLNLALQNLDNIQSVFQIWAILFRLVLFCTGLLRVNHFHFISQHLNFPCQLILIKCRENTFIFKNPMSSMTKMMLLS